MIRNDKQLKTAKRKYGDAVAAAKACSGWEREAYERFAHQLRHEIHEYEAVSNGLISWFGIRCIDDLPNALVRARLAKGWRQRDLAEKLGVSEQMVQRDEAGGYERSALYRLADAADALGYELIGEFRPRNAAVVVDETENASPMEVEIDRAEEQHWVESFGGEEVRFTSMVTKACDA